MSATTAPSADSDRQRSALLRPLHSSRSTVTTTARRGTSSAPSARATHPSSGGFTAGPMPRMSRPTTTSPTSSPGERPPATPAATRRVTGNASSSARTPCPARKGPTPVWVITTCVPARRPRNTREPAKGCRLTSEARATSGSSSSGRAVTMPVSGSVSSARCTLERRGISVLPEPGNRPRERLLDRRLGKTQVADGLAGVEEHPVTRHRHAFEGNRRRPPRDTRDARVDRSDGKRDPVRQLQARRRKPGQARQRLQDLPQGHVPVAEDVALSHLALLGGQHVPLRDVADVYNVQACLHVSGHAAPQEPNDHFPRGCRSHVELADRRRRVHDDDRQSLSHPLVDDSLSLILAPLVVTDHVLEG